MTSVNYSVTRQDMIFRKESIKELRGEIPLREFGRMCGTTGASIMNWEQGYVKPGVDSLLKLASIFNKDLYFFVSNVPQSDTDNKLKAAL